MDVSVSQNTGLRNARMLARLACEFEGVAGDADEKFYGERVRFGEMALNLYAHQIFPNTPASSPVRREFQALSDYVKAAERYFKAYKSAIAEHETFEAGSVMMVNDPSQPYPTEWEKSQAERTRERYAEADELRKGETAARAAFLDLLDSADL